MAEKTERNAAILADRALGATYRDIAAWHGVSVPRVRAIVQSAMRKAHRKRRAREDDGPPPVRTVFYGKAVADRFRATVAAIAEQLEVR